MFNKDVRQISIVRIAYSKNMVWEVTTADAAGHRGPGGACSPAARGPVGEGQTHNASVTWQVPHLWQSRAPGWCRGGTPRTGRTCQEVLAVGLREKEKKGSVPGKEESRCIEGGRVRSCGSSPWQGARRNREKVAETDTGHLLKRAECQTKEADFPCRNGGAMEGHKQVDQKADTSNSGLHRIRLKVGRSISWPSANAEAGGSRTGPGHQQRDEPCLHNFGRVE